MLTQVTVQPDETALFIKEGKVAGVVPQGRSTLDGKLIPFLGDLVDWASGGQHVPRRALISSACANSSVSRSRNGRQHRRPGDRSRGGTACLGEYALNGH